MKRMTLAERDGWRDIARDVGFGFHEMYGEPYWTDGAAYAFTLEQIERDIEDPSQQLHNMCLDLVADIVKSDEMLAHLDIPEVYRDLVRDSWAAGDRHIYGRFDFAYDGKSPAKLLEYNADTPTSIFESAYFQHNWLIDQIEAGGLPDGTDQYNFLQESLVEAFGQFPTDAIFHFACWSESAEDKGTATYLMDCAVQAGHRVQLIDIQEIGVDAQGRFTDNDNRTIDQCFKLYPWEDMLREPFAKHLKPSVFVEPAWKAILSNKAFLPLLWDQYQGHPNLLPTFFEDDPRAGDIERAVLKPFFSREGENVTIREGAAVVEESDGDYGGTARIVQAFAPLFQAGDQHAVLGSWVVGDRACGLGMREDSSRITRDLSRFVPHIITAE
ncbi:MAG: glutathionylspermidine synthase family protein [Hyphomicrobiaceae bacterium]